MRHGYTSYAWIGAVAALSACYPNPRWDVAESDLPDSRAASYAIPSEDPNGEVSLERIDVANDALRLRMMITNFGESDWIVRSAEQRLDIGASSLAPDDASITRVGVGSAEIIELAFRLPESVRDGDWPPQRIVVVWTVHTDHRPVTQLTEFDRVEGVADDGL